VQQVHCRLNASHLHEINTGNKDGIGPTLHNLSNRFSYQSHELNNFKSHPAKFLPCLWERCVALRPKCNKSPWCPATRSCSKSFGQCCPVSTKRKWIIEQSVGNELVAYWFVCQWRNRNWWWCHQRRGSSVLHTLPQPGLDEDSKSRKSNQHFQQIPPWTLNLIPILNYCPVEELHCLQGQSSWIIGKFASHMSTVARQFSLSSLVSTKGRRWSSCLFRTRRWDAVRLLIS